MSILRKYSQSVNPQPNPNLSVKRNDWANIINATGNTNVDATSKYTKTTKNKKVTYTVPHIIAAADFKITSDEIPPTAYINNVTIHLGISVSKGITVKAPVGSFMIYGGKGKVTQHSTDGKTGWYGSTYKVYPNKTLSQSIDDITYTISGTEWNKMQYPTSQIYNTIFGMDFLFREPSKMTGNNAAVSVRYVYIEIDYELPNYVLSYDKATSTVNPVEMNVGETFCLNATFRNTTRANGGNQTVKIKLPFGAELISPNLPRNSDGTYDWNCAGNGFAENYIKLCCVANAFGLRSVNCEHNNVSYPYYIYPRAFQGDYDETNIEHGTIQAGKESCWKFSSKITTTAETVTYNMKVDGENLTDWSKVSDAVKNQYNWQNNGDNLLVRPFELEPDSANQGVSIESYTNNSITFNLIDENGNHVANDTEIKWTGCFIPIISGENTFIVEKGSKTYSKEYDALEPESNNIQFQMNPLIWYDHRVLVQLDTVGHVIPIGVKPEDRVMVEHECRLKAHLQDEVPYIGCVPVQTSHYEPESDYSQGLLKNTYKNKKYMGKDGEIDEEISLKIKLPPKDWTTLQGLSSLDKPVPINLVPKAFEGDVLNHRGWVELYGVKGVNKTNPLVYDGELEVSYLTHNINTRFNITKEQNSNPYNIPLMTATVVESGDEFANYTYINTDGDIVSQDSGYFNVDTDGVYIYDSDTEDALKTYITMDNDQYIKITSKDVLADQTNIIMEWNSTKIKENRENNIERIIYILDKDGTPIFKYQYFDYKFDVSSEYYSCTVKASRLLIDGTWEDLGDKNLLLQSDVESLQLTINADGEVVQEDEPNIDALIDDDEEEDGEDTSEYIFNDFIYGSRLHININGNHINLVDEGYNGKSISYDTDLISSKYFYEVQFQNLNTDGDTLDVITFFDFEVSESLITSDYINEYNDMYISSFPIHGKTLLFTRQCEEGTIYYFKDDGKPFTYIQDPFYMYFCGVDITNKAGSSLFNLDNSYSIFYLTNGLVKLGFNRLNGDLYLYKYDHVANEWIHNVNLHGSSTDFSIGAFSDDKIEIKSGTTIYTMYRGHPYVIINHPDEDLYFDTVFNKVWAEMVNEEVYDYPIYWLLRNNSNLLPSCVAGRDINGSCLTVEEEINPNVTINPTLTLTEPTSTIYNDELSVWSLSATQNILSEGVVILVDGEVQEVIKFNGNNPVTENGEYVYTDLVKENKFGLIFNDNQDHKIRAVYYGNDTKHIAFTEQSIVTPQQREVDTSGQPSGQIPEVGTYELKIIKLPSTYKYMSTPDWAWQLTKANKPIQDKLVQIDLPHGGVWTKTTDANGMVYQKLPDLNNSDTLNAFRNWDVGTHTIRARFYNFEEGHTNELLHQVSRKVKIEKANPLMEFKKAVKKGKQAKFILTDPQGKILKNKNVTISVNGGKKYPRTTGVNGSAALTINKKGHKKYKVTYAGDKNLNKKTWTFEEDVS